MLPRGRWRSGLASRLRPQLVEDRPQGPNTIAEGVLGSTDELDQLDGQNGFFFVREIKVRHNPDMGWRSTNVPTRCSRRRRDGKPGSWKRTSQPAFARIGNPR